MWCVCSSRRPPTKCSSSVRSELLRAPGGPVCPQPSDDGRWHETRYAPSVTGAHPLHYDYADYLASLDASALKLEYCRGVIYAMAGGTRAHAQLSAAVIVALAKALPRTCRVATSDLKVRVEPLDLSTFPDASVTCGEARSSSMDANAVVNPTLLVDVTSKSTEDYDRGEKLDGYKQLESLHAVLIVSHRSRRVTIVERRDGMGWTEREAGGGENVELALHDTSFSVDSVYDGIELDKV
jgi:Uma2 family endonuclease